MVELNTISLQLGRQKLQMGFSNYDSRSDAVDVIMKMEYDPSLALNTIESEPFYMSRQELTRFACYLNEISVNDSTAAEFPYVPTNLGFELTWFDNDTYDLTVELFIKIGEADDGREYAGYRGQAKSEDVLIFRDQLNRVNSNFC